MLALCLYMQAQEETAQLQKELESALSQQEALQQALQEMQATITVLRNQIQYQADCTAAAAASQDSGTVQQQRDGSEEQLPGPTSSTDALVQALQQQVADLRAISSYLDDSQQQQLADDWGTAAPVSVQHVKPGSSVTGGSTHFGSAAQKHECMMPPPPPRSMPTSRRIAMSAYASPASCSHVRPSDAIKAHHRVKQPAAAPGAMAAAQAGAASFNDKCWCGRPKKIAGSAQCTPVKHTMLDTQNIAHAWHGQQEGFVPSYSSSPISSSVR